MPRHRRLEVPGAVYHVITRGIERRDIFKDDGDYEEFLRRLKEGLEDTGSKCYGWALMPNHFHLLIQTGKKPLSDLMRKLLTGYAMYFNAHHKRRGYVYQNRYKSILCQAEVYLLELVRYIHLNPLRAKLVPNMEELRKYPWCGHGAIMGNRKNDWQTTDDILERFGKSRREARFHYEKFLEEAKDKGRRDDLTGGGLRRSAGGWAGVMALRKDGRWLGDERVLGDGTFVESVLKESEEEIVRHQKLEQAGWNGSRLIAHVCKIFNITPEELRKKGHGNNVSKAKGLVAYWGKNDLKLQGTELATMLGITRQAVSLLKAQGEAYATKNDLILTS
jgi:REP element-mobilizing transposase RayT